MLIHMYTIFGPVTIRYPESFRRDGPGDVTARRVDPPYSAGAIRTPNSRPASSSQVQAYWAKLRCT